jgi:hypothetical protein
MALTARTLAAAMLAGDTVVSLDSATGVTAPNFTTGVGITYLLVESEFMLVTGVTAVSTVFTVQRGVLGSAVSPHAITATALAGVPTDFAGQAIAVKAQQDPSPTGQLYGMGGPVAAAATIVATGPLFHVTGTTVTNIITPPSGFIEGQITIIAEGAWSFTSSNVTNGISCSGTVTTANSCITFLFDAGTSRWYPSRLA